MGGIYNANIDIHLNADTLSITYTIVICMECMQYAYVCSVCSMCSVTYTHTVCSVTYTYTV